MLYVPPSPSSRLTSSALCWFASAGATQRRTLKTLAAHCVRRRGPFDGSLVREDGWGDGRGRWWRTPSRGPSRPGACLADDAGVQGGGGGRGGRAELGWRRGQPEGRGKKKFETVGQPLGQEPRGLRLDEPHRRRRHGGRVPRREHAPTRPSRGPSRSFASGNPPPTPSSFAGFTEEARTGSSGSSTPTSSASTASGVSAACSSWSLSSPSGEALVTRMKRAPRGLPLEEAVRFFDRGMGRRRRGTFARRGASRPEAGKPVRHGRWARARRCSTSASRAPSTRPIARVS